MLVLSIFGLVLIVMAIFGQILAAHRESMRSIQVIAQLRTELANSERLCKAWKECYWKLDAECHKDEEESPDV